MLRTTTASLGLFVLFVAAPASAIRFGVQIAPENATYAELVETFRVIEDAGYDSAWLNDHFMPVIGDKDGRHKFARTYEEHQQNIEAARAAGLL